MNTTNKYGFRKPEVNDFISVDDLNFNADKAEEVLNDLETKKVDISGGDISAAVTALEEPTSAMGKYPEISGKGSAKTVLGKLYRWVKSLKADKVDARGGNVSETTATAFINSHEQYPLPAPGDSMEIILGKIKKFGQDIRSTAIGACYIGQIVNNCVTDRNDLPLSAAQGKVLMDLYTVLNTKLSETDSRQGIPPYSADIFLSQGGGRLLYYDANTANTPFKAGVTQASEGIAITVGDWGNFLTSLAIPKGGSTIFIYSRSNGETNNWKAIS